jgi:hypothetical protein
MHKPQRPGPELEAYKTGACHKPRKWAFLSKKDIGKESARPGTQKKSKWPYILET